MSRPLFSNPDNDPRIIRIRLRQIKRCKLMQKILDALGSRADAATMLQTWDQLYEAKK